MTKAELIESIQKQIGGGVGKRTAEMALNAVIGAVKDGLDQWQDVRIPGFGTFKAEIREGREYNNLHGDGKIYVGPKRVVKFKASSKL